MLYHSSLCYVFTCQLKLYFFFFHLRSHSCSEIYKMITQHFVLTNFEWLFVFCTLNV